MRRVFLDTSVLKFSINSRTALQPRMQEISWGGRVFRGPVYDIVDEIPNEKITDSRLRAEVDLLPTIAELARAGIVELLLHGEVQIESWGILTFGGGQPTLLDAPVTHVNGPIEYSRLLGPILPESNGKRVGHRTQVKFLASLEHKRFLQLQKACGAYQGSHTAENELIDAFHVWSAEEAGATEFLTCDFKLVRLVRQTKRYRPTVNLVTPSELLKLIELDQTKTASA